MAEITPRQQANRDQLDAAIRDLLNELIDAAGAGEEANKAAVTIAAWRLQVPDRLHGDRAALTNLLLIEAVARLAGQRRRRAAGEDAAR